MLNFFKRQDKLSPEDQIFNNRYDLIKKISEGAFGDVYLAKDLSLDREVAIKVLKESWLNQNTKQQTQDKKTRSLNNFITEAKVTCRVQHANAVLVYDMGVYNNDLLFLVMELINGRTLSDYFNEHNQQLTLPAIFSIIKQICAALSQAHSKSIVHRDLKPDNIMLSLSGQGEEQVKVLDFGIATIMGQNLQSDQDFFGTPQYASPEQCACQSVDARSDIYSLGIILYQLLSNNCHPFPNATQPMEYIHHQMNNITLIPLIKANSVTRISPEINRVVMRCLEKQPDLRYPSVIEFLSDLKKAFFGLPVVAVSTEQTVQQITMDQMLDAYETALAQFQQGNYASAFESMNALIEQEVLDPQIIYLAILSLARSGAYELARNYWHRYGNLLPKTEENMALNARLLKDEFKHAHNHKTGIDARDEYLRISQLNHTATSSYPLINAATLSLLLGDIDQAHELAHQVLEICKSERQDYWRLVTEAEASLLLNEVSNAESLLIRAGQLVNINQSDLNTTFQQLLLICQANQIDEKVLLAIKPPSIAHYTGHMIYGVGSSIGIDPDDEVLLRHKAEALIKQQPISIAYGALACGADIIFAEVLIECESELHVVLPFEIEVFVKISVLPGGENWKQRFYRLLSKASSVKIVSQVVHSDLGLLFQLNTDYAIGLTLLHARQLHTRAIQLSMFNGIDTDLKAGTAADVKRWQKLGYQSFTITTPKPRQKVKPVSYPESLLCSELQENKVFIVAKIVQYSKIPEAELPEFIDLCAARLNKHIQPYIDHPDALEMWGDSFLFTLDNIEKAANLSTQVTHSLSLDEEQDGNAIGLQIFIHSGLVFHNEKSMLGKQRFYGKNILKTGKMLANLPINSIYVSEDYAAQLILEAPDKYRYCYAGQQVLSDHADTFRLYSIHPL